MPSLAPTPSLSRFVEDVRVMEAAGDGPFDVELLPDGRTGIYYRLTDGGRSADLTVAGPRTRAKFKRATGVVHAVVFQFRPGWSTAVLGVATSELTDRVVDLQELWGHAADDLRDELVVAGSVPVAIARLTDALAVRTRAALESSSARIARRAARLLEGDEVRVERVAAQLGVTARHLRRAFTESVGVGPKEFARAVRLQRAVRLATTSTDWGRIAAAAGYYDQAHLITDFRALVGLTPGAFAKRATDRAAPRQDAAPPALSVSSNRRAAPVAMLRP